MKRSRIALCTALIILAMGIIAPVSLRAAAIGDAPALADSSLMDMLKLVPAFNVTITDPILISYVNYRAVETARGLEKPAAADILGGSGYWINNSMRIIAGPPLSYLRQQLSDMPDLVGFSWTDIDRALTFGNPPRDATLFAGQFDADAINAALTPRGFAQEDYNGVTIWTRFDDGAVSIKDHEAGDPFGGELGQAARIAFFPAEGGDAYLANSAFTGVTHAVVDAWTDNTPSLADLQSPDDATVTEAAHTLVTSGRDGLITTVEAVDDAGSYSGPLIQALAFHVSQVGLVPGDPAAVLGGDGASTLAGYGTLPIYEIAMLADRQDGPDEVAIIALNYSDSDTAQAAADELQARVSTLALPNHDQPLVEELGSTLDTHVFCSGDTGQCAAVLEVRTPTPALGATDDNGQLLRPGRMIGTWVRMIYQRAFTPIMIPPEDGG